MKIFKNFKLFAFLSFFILNQKLDGSSFEDMHRRFGNFYSTLTIKDQYFAESVSPRFLRGATNHDWVTTGIVINIDGVEIEKIVPAKKSLSLDGYLEPIIPSGESYIEHVASNKAFAIAARKDQPGKDEASIKAAVRKYIMDQKGRRICCPIF